MNLKRMIAAILSLTCLLGAFASCKQDKQEGTPTEGLPTQGTTTNGDTVIETPPEDTWMDIWDTDPTFVPLANDAALDTKGTAENGAWFDSFTVKRNQMYWNQNTLAKVAYDNTAGTVTLQCDKTGDLGYFSRSTDGKREFEVEVRMKVEDFGSNAGFSLTYNGKRAIVYLYEIKIKMNLERQMPDENLDSRADLVYVDIGTDWHTFRMHVRDDIMDLYMDDVYLASAQCEPAKGQNRFEMFSGTHYDGVPGHIIVDYVSYKPLEDKKISISSPTRGQVCGTGESDVTVSCEIDTTFAAENRTVSYYLNDVYAGTSSSTDPQITFSKLDTGVYEVYAVCGDQVTPSRVFVIEEPAENAQINATYSTAALLQSSYVLKYSVGGPGALTASDGLHSLKLRYQGGKVTYTTVSGDVVADAANGDAIAVVDGGAAWLYANGKMIASFILPMEGGESTVKTTGLLENLSVEALNGTLYQKNFDGAAALNLDPGYTGYNYAVEFSFEKGKALELNYADGAFLLSFVISADGTLTAVGAPLKNAKSEVVTTLPDGRNHYRICVSSGIAMLYVNNVWCGSWRMSQSVANRNLFLLGDGIGRISLRQLGDRFYWSGKSTEDAWGEAFSSPFETYGNVLKLYSKDTEVSAKLNLAANVSGRFLLVARYGRDFNQKGVFAGYDATNKCFLMGDTLSNLQAVGASKTFTGTVELTLCVKDQSVTLYANGEVVATGSTTLNGWGNAGYYNTGAGSGLLLSSFSYAGDGNALCDTTTTTINTYHTICMFELGNRIYMHNEADKAWVSTDGGYTFTETNEMAGYRHINTIVLQSGKILSIKRVARSGGYAYDAYVSSNGGTTFSGPYAVMVDGNHYRTIMNGKVVQLSTGRIILVVGEVASEDYGGLHIYYSDNEGLLWKRFRTEFNYGTTRMNLQEGVVVELDGGVIRMYARTDNGFLVYTDSHDYGKTWDMQMKNTGFASVVSAFNVTRDKDTGYLYMAWEYNNINDSSVVQFPRTRVALALSVDNANTWQYVGDFDELNDISYRNFGHWNIGVWTTKDHVYVTVGKRVGNAWWPGGDVRWCNYAVRIGKESIQPMVRFNNLHGVFADPARFRLGTKLVVNGVLAISSTGNRVYASGDYYDIQAVNGKRTKLSVEMIASLLNAQLTLTDQTAVIRLGNVEYVFTGGADKATIAGEEKGMTFAASFENGTVWVTVEDLCELLDLTARKAENGAIVLTTSKDPVRLEHLLSQVGIW